MELWMVAAIALAVLLATIALEVPIAFALAGSGLTGLALMREPQVVLSIVASMTYETSSSYTLTVIPMYVLLGVLALHGRLGIQLFEVADRVFHKMPGGLGVATIGASAGFGAVSGSTAAAAVTMGRLTIPRMLSQGYRPQFASAIASVGGTLDALIPPSIILVIYAVITQVSTGSMLIAGIIPGLLTALAYGAYISIRSATKEPGSDESVIADIDHPVPGPSGFPLAGLLRAGLLFGIVIGGIYTGYFTPTEAGAIGAAVSLVMLALDFRGRGFRAFAGVLRLSLSETAVTTSMVLAILFGAALFSNMLVLTGLPREMASFMAGLDLKPTTFMLIVVLLMLPLGMFLESMSILTIVVPFIAPIMVTLGVDPIWAGIIIVKAIAIGMITPPVGIVPFIIAGAVPGIRVQDIFRGIIPFVVIDLCVIALLLAVPVLVTGLPSIGSQ